MGYYNFPMIPDFAFFKNIFIYFFLYVFLKLRLKEIFFFFFPAKKFSAKKFFGSFRKIKHNFFRFGLRKF